MSGVHAGNSSRNRQNGSGFSGRSTRGGQKTERSPTMRGMPLTSSGAICVPTSERHGSPAAAPAWGGATPSPGGAPGGLPPPARLSGTACQLQSVERSLPRGGRRAQLDDVAVRVGDEYL